MRKVYKLARIGFYVVIIGAFSWMISFVGSKKDTNRYTEINPMLPGVSVAHADVPATGGGGDGCGGGGET